MNMKRYLILKLWIPNHFILCILPLLLQVHLHRWSKYFPSILWNSLGFQRKFLWSCPFLQQRLQNAHSTHNIGRVDEFCKRENGKKIINAEKTQFFIKMIFTKKYSTFLCKIPWARVSKHLPCKAQQFFNKLVRWLSVDWNKKKQCYVKRYVE